MTTEAKAGDVLKVGATVWVFDSNRRVYAKDGKGGPIWREHWRPETVTGETRVSWIIGAARKVAKREPLPWHVCASEEEVDRRAWVNDNAHKLAVAVRQCRDFDTLQQVAAIVSSEPLRGGEK